MITKSTLHLIKNAMKKYTIILVLSSLFNISVFAQFIEFRSLQRPYNSQQVQSNYETKTVKGYVLSESGEITKIIQLKLNITNGVIKIIAYYRVNPTFGGGSWFNLNSPLSVKSISGKIPISNKEKVAFSNFTNCADGYYLEANDIVWFNE